MAKARMLHRTISISSQVNKLTLPSRLLFTWMIAYADDDGRLKGEAEYIKAMVVPMTNWSLKKIDGYVAEMHEAGLVIRWSDRETNECFIEFPNWKRYQQIKSDRYKPSDLPSYQDKNGDKKSTDVIRDVSTLSPQSNAIKSSPIVNKSEANRMEREFEEELIGIADKNISGTPSLSSVITNPRTFKPNNNEEHAALEAWKRLEPKNPFAFQTTYLKAVKLGVPPDKILQFTSEIEQDPNIRNRGAVFNKKVDEYIAQKSPK